MVNTLRNNELGMQSGFRAYILKIILRYCGTSACITRNNLYVLNDTITLCKATSFAVVKVYFEQLISEHVLDKSWLGIIVYHIQHARVR